jgi:myo-inositol 2-dehydrogenase / D-chiro-inositol 1-dehydrogenase
MAMEYRYMAAAAELIGLVHEGAVGTPRMVAIREHRFPFLVKVDNWNRFSENTGGTLVEKCCHFFDLMNLILRERPVRVMASGAQDVNHLDEEYDGRTPDILDNAFVIVDYERAAPAPCSTCACSPRRPTTRRSCRSWASGQGRGADPANTVRVGRRGEHWIGGVEEYTAHDPRVQHEGLHHGSSYIEHVLFAETIRTGGQPAVTLADGYWAVAIGAAAHRSIELGRPVELSELMDDELAGNTQYTNNDLEGASA